MPHRQINSGSLRQFLRILGVANRKPSIEAMFELVTAFMLRVPFENVSKLYYMKRYGLRGIPALEQYLEGIERYKFGGTCYSNNYYMHLLLTYLGYDVMLCGADMDHPDVHLVNIVSLDGREFLVDAGYAAPFLEPLPCDLKQDHIISLGRDRYILKPRDSDGCSRMELYQDGLLRHGYTAKPIPRQIEHFDQVIEESYRPTATFMNALLLVRFYPNRSIRIHNLSVVESEGVECNIRQLEDRNELPIAVEKHFSIPHEIVAGVVDMLGEFGDAWS